MSETIAKYKHLIFILLGILVLLVYGYHLQIPPEPYYDEVHYVGFIQRLIYQNHYDLYANGHPPLWHLLAVLCVEIFGDHSFVWRIVSLGAGLVVIYLVYILAKKIIGNVQAAALAAFFIIFDCMSFTQARIAMMNSTMLLFMLLSINYFLDAFEKEKPLKPDALRHCGLFFALALSTKLVSASLLLFFAPLFALEFKKRKSESGLILRNILLYFVLSPLAILFCVHIFIPFLKNGSFADIWKNFAFNINYHMTTKQGHTYASRWWSWPLMLRPIWFYFKGYAWDTPGASCSGIICIGNPAIFWLIPVVIGNLIWDFLKRKSSVSGLILWGFLTQWLSYAFFGRVQFFHYFYSALPFVAMGTAILITRMWQAGKTGKVMAAFYLVLVAGMFIYWYPLLNGLPISSKSYLQHMWFRKWI